MSNIVTSLVRRRNLGVGFTAKSVLYLMADFASDDGRGIYASKVTMANQLETTDRTLRRAVKVLEDAGFIRAVGAHRVKNVETVEYEIDVEAVESMPESNPKARTERPAKVQDVDKASQDLARTESPGGQDVTPKDDEGRTESPGRADRESGDPGQRVRQTKGNQKEPIVCSADAATHTHWLEFWKSHPRPRSEDETRDEFERAVASGVDPDWLVASAKAYALENKGNGRQYLTFSDNWLRDGRWKDHPKPQKSTPADQVKVDQRVADAIKTRSRPFLYQRLAPETVRRLLSKNLVTKDDLREAGL